MFLHDTSGIKNRHLPTSEFHHLGTQCHVPIIEDSSVKLAHRSFTSPLVPENYLAFDEGFELTEAFFDIRCVDARVG